MPLNEISISDNATPEHESEAVRMAEKGIVLLENDGILPLKENAQKILITGFNADNNWLTSEIILEIRRILLWLQKLFHNITLILNL